MPGHALKRTLILLGILALIISCATMTPIARPDGTVVAGLPARSVAYVTVNNENWNLVRVYISENGNQPRRLGSVETGSRTTFPFAVQSGAHYLFTIIPLASNEAYTTEGIAVDVGDTLRLGVANHLNFTTVYRQPQVQ